MCPSCSWRCAGRERVRANIKLDWTEEETQIPGGNAHLWEESWDDDDTNEDFAVQLRYGKRALLVVLELTMCREELKKLGK